MRTVGVLLGAVIGSFVTDAILRHFLAPGFGQLIVRMYATPPDSKQWDEIWRQWHHVNLVSSFILAPVSGLAGGIFVGLLQKHYQLLVAASTQIPELLFHLWNDRTHFRVHPLYGAAGSLGQHLLPVVAAILGAALVHRVMASRRTSNPATPASTASLA